ncbi:retroviral-like aspartic protease family protein [Flavobacterium sp.]|uniref:retroviral-like aspartic protease family protein n=1 Tax=Flavobacterium sp. TaxID=239 RepID=UPI0037507372
MKIFKKLTLLILATSFILSCGPLKKLRTVTQGKVDKTNFIEEIPFEYYNEQIFIDVEINNKKHKFIFDTGAYLTVLNEGLITDMNYKSKKIGHNITDANGNKSYSEYIEIKNIKLGNIDFLNTGATTMNLSHFKEMFGCTPFDGIIGANLMRKAKWQIDYTKKTIRFTDNIENFPSSKKTIIFDMNSGNYGNFKLDLNINGIQEKFTFDTGYSGKISANKSLLDKINTNNNLDYTIQNGLTSIVAFGKSTGKSYYTNIQKLKFGANEFNNQIVRFSENSTNLIGNEFLKNYVVTIDWDKEKTYLDPITEIESDRLNVFEILIAPNFSDNSIQVYNSWEDHKLQNQIEIGTKITAINKIDVSKFNQQELCDFWTNKKRTIFDKETIEIEINDKSVRRNVILTKKQLLPKPFVK